MKKVLNYAHLFKTSEDCDKFSTRFLHKNLIAGTAISGSAEKQTQCLSNGSAITPLTAVSTLKSLFRNSSKVMEKFLQILQRHSEAEPKNPRKVQHNDWILHFAFAPFRMTIPAQALALILTFGTISESRADPPAGCIGAEYLGCGWKCDSCEDGYEFYNNCWFKSCRKSCTANEERVDGVCVAMPTCEKGGLACKNAKTQRSIANCCIKNEGNLSTIYRRDDSQLASIPAGSNLIVPEGNDLIISDGFSSFGDAEVLSNKIGTLIVPESFHFGSFWNSNGTSAQYCIVPDTATNVDACGKVVCLGDVEKCKSNLRFSSGSYRVVSPTESQCNSSGTYYYTGSECVKRPAAGTDITCDYEVKGYVKVGNYCASPENSYAKKHYTPAEAAQWLKDDDNTVVLTFKK